MALLDIASTETSGTSVLRLSGELDISTAPTLADALAQAEAERPRVVVLDLRPLGFLDSTGLRLILAAHARTQEAGGRLVLVRGPDAVQRIFDVTRLEERLAFVDDPGELLAV